MAHPSDLSPTQVAFGEVSATCKRRTLEKKAAGKKHHKHMRGYLKEHVAPAVLGPKEKIYITDHHHFAHALLKAFLPYEKSTHDRSMYVCITEDASHMPQHEFWGHMERQELVRLTDERGHNITYKQLPTSVKYLMDDPYRTLSAWARESFAYVKCGSKHVDETFPQCKGGVVAKPFIEFKWADLYRHKFKVDSIYLESGQEQQLAFTKFFKDIIQFSLTDENKGVEGWNQIQHTEEVTVDTFGCISKTPKYQVVLM